MIPTSSQTVGPFFRIGLNYLIDRAPELEAVRRIEIRGRVLDRDGRAVPDAVLEFWAGDVIGPTGESFPARFQRAATDGDGQFAVTMGKPDALVLEDGRLQSPHVLVLVFARACFAICSRGCTSNMRAGIRWIRCLNGDSSKPTWHADGSTSE